jgi:catechol 2,3-dioxygenase-like lactoylglutathione lyase family enzyme
MTLHPASAATVVAILLAFATPCMIHPQNTNECPRREIPVLQSTCLISADVRRLVEFYEPILNRKANWSGQDYAEFPTSAGVLAIFSAAAQEKYIPGSSKPATNRSIILEFKVADADAEYRRLQPLVKTWVKPPTTQPWGTRSIYFRDPDENLVDFYSPVPAPK